MGKSREYGGVDYFRMVAALLVVAIHVAPFSMWSPKLDGVLTYGIGRVAVPFFLMTTGYFVLAPIVNAVNRKRKKMRLEKFFVKNITVYLGVSVFYVPINLYAKKLTGGIGGFAKALFFDGTFYHLWYFPAVLMGSVILLALYRVSRLAATVYAMSAYLIGLGGDSYYGLVSKIEVVKNFYNGIFKISSYTRNGIFFTPLFLLLGIWIARLGRQRIENAKFWLLVSLGFLLIESGVTGALGWQRHNSMYLSLVPASGLLFYLLTKWQVSAPKRLRTESMLIFLFHPIAIIVVHAFSKFIVVLQKNALAQYGVVCMLSIFGARLATWLLDYYKKRQNVDC